MHIEPTLERWICMKTIKIPYYTSSLDLHIGEENLEAVITAKTDEYDAGKSEAQLVEEALANPIGTPRLSELAKGKNRVVLVTSDHTRAVPSKLTLPILLREIRSGNPDADITILIATGCHRGTTKEELIGKFGEEIVETEPGVRGDTATNVTKPAKIDNGFEIQVPLFINQGDIVKIDTRTGTYAERVSKK